MSDETGWKVGPDHFFPMVEEERKHRILEITDNTATAVRGAITKYCAWEYPTLELGSGLSQFTKDLVGSDPLYVTDCLPELLDEVVEQFNPVYQKRVRPYLIDYRLQDYSKLPQGQFGFVFAWNVLNYYTMPKIIRLLPKIERLLRPGGTFMFSYNNSDRYWCGKYVELGKASSVPYRLLSELVQDEGWEITKAVDIETNVSWIEIKRPGELETAKLHPSLGEIIP
jgi:SAM-dependent methyltransferase